MHNFHFVCLKRVINGGKNYQVKGNLYKKYYFSKVVPGRIVWSLNDEISDSEIDTGPDEPRPYVLKLILHGLLMHLCKVCVDASITS